MINKDQLDMVPAHQVLQASYGALDGAQDAPHATQVMAHTVLFWELCSVLNLDPSEMLNKARRVSQHARENRSLELRALHDYIRKELNA